MLKQGKQGQNLPYPNYFYYVWWNQGNTHTHTQENIVLKFEKWQNEMMWKSSSHNIVGDGDVNFDVGNDIHVAVSDLLGWGYWQWWYSLQEIVVFQKTNLTEMSTMTKGYVHFD
jgi:hypothetical protein